MNPKNKNLSEKKYIIKVEDTRFWSLGFSVIREFYLNAVKKSRLHNNSTVNRCGNVYLSAPYVEDNNVYLRHHRNVRDLSVGRSSDGSGVSNIISVAILITCVAGNRVHFRQPLVHTSRFLSFLYSCLGELIL